MHTPGGAPENGHPQRSSILEVSNEPKRPCSALFGA